MLIEFDPEIGLYELVTPETCNTSANWNMHSDTPKIPRLKEL